ncbi:helix-turn-helix domain-containing protein [Epidermidibacterium keratini]|uniref:Helix-turn-helix domain-containing protein n=1 Tax=Epidermidibacterium keratini TaxID=1891644 RepID=A0A7L4YRE0_9ACTN|nr:helix-turn-helix transcriptional regulator [Epidermidibacterium keratini]QHC01513.1 helix-turn-helix domain-containing protein [Epidermidibacterium keratini]
MTTTLEREEVGGLVREWRQRRRLSQQALSERCGVSTRHLSYIETGKSQPSRDMIAHLSQALEVPLRAQRQWYAAAGLAPPATELPLDAPPLRQVNAAIEAILAGHEPYPALVIDGGWDLIAANDAAYSLLAGVSPHLLEPPVNVVRLSLDSDGLASRIVNADQWRAGILGRISHEYAASADPRLGRLLADFGEPTPAPTGPPDIVLTLSLRVGEHVLSFLTTTTVFGTPRDVTVAELAIEALYPADDATRAFLTG